MIDKLIFNLHQLPTDLTEDSGLLEGMAIWAYNVTNGLFWTTLLLGFCLVLFISTSRYSTDRAFGYAGISGLFGSLFLVTLGLIPWLYASIFIIVGVISVVTMIMSRRG